MGDGKCPEDLFKCFYLHQTIIGDPPVWQRDGGEWIHPDLGWIPAGICSKECGGEDLLVIRTISNRKARGIDFPFRPRIISRISFRDLQPVCFHICEKR